MAPRLVLTENMRVTPFFDDRLGSSGRNETRIFPAVTRTLPDIA
jgi:hypothetical protein